MKVLSSLGKSVYSLLLKSEIC